MSLPSTRFAAIYDSLPADVQARIVGKQLIPLLDLVSKAKRRKVVSSASKMKRRHAAIPILDIKSKQREVAGLLDELHRDAKRSFVRERSHRTELLEQTVESVTCWLNDIWRVVYEHNVDFMLAHRCLLFVVTTLDQLGHGRSSCRCAFTSMYISITLKKRSGKVVKSWHVNGAHNIEEVLQFIWRDLFLSLLATGSPRQIKKIPEMLEDIEEFLGWTALERLLYGGRKCPHDIDLDPDETDAAGESESDLNLDENEDAYTDDDSELDLPIEKNDWTTQVWHFRKHVHAAMTAVFKVNPSLRLYSALLASSTDPETTEAELMAYLDQTATSCPEIFSAALDIHALESNTAMISSLLSTHNHLIRPRDAPIYQSAVTTLASEPLYHQRAFQIIEKELLETASAVRTALLGPFSLLDSAENKTEIEQIMKLRPSAQARQDRIDRWTEAITTPGTNNPNPMALAAIVMGLPIVPAFEGIDDADPLGYLDLDPSDPDMEDLREEFRPRLKQRFEGWAETAASVKGGTAILVKIYQELVRTMPYLRATDVVEEMLARLAEKPSKQYLIDAVDALSTFVKIQRRKLATFKMDKKHRVRTHAATQTPTPAVGSSTAGPSTSGVSPAPTTTGRAQPETPPLPLETVMPPSSSASMWTPPQTFGAGPSTSTSTSTPTPAFATPEREDTPPPFMPTHAEPQLHVHTHGPAPAPAPLFTFFTGPIPGSQPGGPGGGGGFAPFGGYGAFGGFGGGGMEDVD